MKSTEQDFPSFEQLDIAVSNNNIPEVIELIRQFESNNFNAQEYYIKAFYSIIERSYPDMLQLLAEHMTPETLNSTEFSRSTPLRVAYGFQTKGLPAFKCLLENGAILHNIYLGQKDSHTKLLKAASVLRDICSLNPELSQDIKALEDLDLKELKEFAQNIMINYLRNNDIPNHDHYIESLCKSFANLSEGVVVETIRVLVNTSFTYFKFAESLESLESLESELLHLAKNLKIVPYSDIKDLFAPEYEGFKVVGLDEIAEFYNKNPQYKIPGTYISELINTPSCITDISELNLLLLQNPHLSETITRILPIFQAELKYKLKMVMDNYELQASDSKLLEEVALLLEKLNIEYDASNTPAPTDEQEVLSSLCDDIEINVTGDVDSAQ